MGVGEERRWGWDGRGDLLLPSVAESGGGVGGATGEMGGFHAEGGGFQRLFGIVRRPLEGGGSGFIAISF